MNVNHICDCKFFFKNQETELLHSCKLNIKVQNKVQKPMRDPAFVLAAWFTRLMNDQRGRRYESRKALFLRDHGLQDVKKIPVDTAELGTRLEPSAPTSSSNPAAISDVASVAPSASMPAEVEDDDDDLANLGLEKKGLQQPKKLLRRSQDQIREEEVNKLQKEFEELIAKCSNLPSSAPTKDFGRVDRMIQRMVKNLKGENSGAAYDSLTLVNKLGADLIVARDATKACVSFMTGSAVTRKKCQQDRWLLNFPIA